MLRRIFLGVYVTGLAVSLALALWGLAVTANLYGNESREHALGRGITSLVALLISVGFLLPLRKHQFRPIAVPALAVSLVATTICVRYFVNGYVKKWAPSAASEAAQANRLGFALLALMFSIVAGIIWALTRKPGHGG